MFYRQMKSKMSEILTRLDFNLLFIEENLEIIIYSRIINFV